MVSFRSCHLIVSRKLADGGWYVFYFIKADYFIREVYLLDFLNRLHAQKETFFSLAIMLIVGKLYLYCQRFHFYSMWGTEIGGTYYQ